jgi:signal transduction histidine kinase
MADQLRLEQALGNLIDNALRHGEGVVNLVAVAGDGRLRIHVRDDGPGFPREFLSGAFERFTRADSARGRGGAGLGLAIVKAIAEAHGGDARAQNRPTGGADVFLDLDMQGALSVRDEGSSPSAVSLARFRPRRRSTPQRR